MAIIEQLLARPASAGRALVVAIDGRGGSGKSTFARLLAERFGAEIVQTDDFASADNPLDWWPRVISDILEPLADGATSLTYDRSAFLPEHPRSPVVDQPVTDVLLLEGVSASRREFRAWLGASIFVGTPRQVCIDRGVARDLAGGGYDSEDQVRALWEEWIADEDAYLERDDPAGYADLVINGMQPFTTQV